MSASESQTGRKQRGRAAIAILLVLPALTLWNLYALSHKPKLRAMIGRLHGVTAPETPVKFGFRSFADGSWQKFVTDAVRDAYPLRPVLIKLNNQIRFVLFGVSPVPGVVMGDNGQLIEQNYLTEYCRRNTAELEAKAHEWITKLKELQDFYEARGHVFIYLITPSKAAYMPENFFPRLPCASREADQKEKLPAYDRMLTKAGIHYVDAATLTHSLKGKYPVDIFPQGGVHWNAIGVANAANAVLAEINARKRQEAAPKLAWTYQVTNTAKGQDRDLANLINILRPNVSYKTASVTYQPTECDRFPVSRQDVAIIGGSFIDMLAKTLVNEGCLSKLRGYNYLYRGLREGSKYRAVKRRLTAEDIVPVRDADIVILEENESLAPGAAHAREFHRVILGK